MRPVLLLIAAIIASLACGALLATPVYYFFQAISTDISYHKIISHVSSISGLLFIFLFLKLHGILNIETVGYQARQKHYLYEIITGIGFGILIMLIMEIILYFLGIHQAETDRDLNMQFFVNIFIKGILAGLFVGFLEETLYRGALLGGLNKLVGSLPAILISSTLYSAVHFIKYPSLAADANISWTTGFILLSHAFSRFGDPAIFDSFLALFAFGVLLALVRLNKGHIYQCIGIHAGVVFTINLINKLTDYMPANNFEFLVNKYDHTLGYLAFGWLILISITYYNRHSGVR